MKGNKMKKIKLNRWVILVGALGVVGCGFLSDSATSLLVPPSEEVKLGLELAAEVEQELVLHPDAQVQADRTVLGLAVGRIGWLCWLSSTLPPAGGGPPIP